VLSERVADREDARMDGAGYQELFHGQFAAMTRLAAMLGADDPEDVAQEAFVRLHRRSRTLRDPHAAVAYLRSTVVNLTRSRLRHLSVVRRLAPGSPPDVPSAEHDVVRRESHRHLLARLGSSRRDTGKPWCCATGWTCPRQRWPRR
jgi:DNA-directed RNA polymerase specialized sigma24 family protein